MKLKILLQTSRILFWILNVHIVLSHFQFFEWSKINGLKEIESWRVSGKKTTSNSEFKKREKKTHYDVE